MEFFEGLFTLQSLFTLLMLILLQAVLGFDNLLYISIESKRVEESQQARLRRIGIVMAIGLRIVLLFLVKGMISLFEDPFLSFGIDTSQLAAHGAETAESLAEGAASGEAHDVSGATGSGEHAIPTTNSWLAFAFNLESIVVLFGGGFILYTAIKEIFHMVSVQHLDHDGGPTRSFGAALFWIVLMNLVFSFDSILSAMALTGNMIVMSTAIIVSGIMMIVLADNVSTFLKKNRMYEVLGLFILFVVGVMLVSEGGHKAHLVLFGYPVEAMQKSTFYFVIAVMVVVDIVQGRYQKKLLAETEAAGSHANSEEKGHA